MRGRLVLLGIDGASYEMVTRLVAQGALPNLLRLSQEGTLRPMTSSLPEVSPVAWSSIITGANPGAHGVYGFTDLAPGSYRTTFTSSHSRALRPFWERATNGRAVVINMPFTYPAQPMNGALIAGFVALDLVKATYPPELVPELQRLGYRTDVDSNKAHQSLGLFLRDLDRTLEARIAAYRHLWDAEPWQTFVLVFTGTDRLSHFLWDAFEDSDHPHHQAFVDHFGRVDAVVGEIADRLRPEDALLIVSDHGFEGLQQDVYVNAVLRESGHLRFETAAPRGIRDIAADACAFALEPSRIYVHTAKYPKGAVEESQREAVIRDVERLFQDLTFEGQPVIKSVLPKQDIYQGPLVDRAPDLVLLAEQGFNLRAGLKDGAIFRESVFKGKHTREGAILLVYGDHNPSWIPERVHVTDVVQLADRFVLRD